MTPLKFKTGQVVKLRFKTGTVVECYVVATYTDEEGVRRVRCRHETVRPGNRALRITELKTYSDYCPTEEKLTQMQGD